MEQLDRQHRDVIQGILSGANDMTLATVRDDGYPQATTVSFVARGLTLYAGIGRDSQKAHNISHNDKVSLTVDLPYGDWSEIRGVSLSGHAALVDDPAETASVQEEFMHKFPAIKRMIEGTGTQPWEEAVFVRIEPEVISLLDYTQGFGHTELYAVPAELRH